MCQRISVPAAPLSGHWIMEEQPEQAVDIILSFLKGE
jgi:pimeloyl-ACP methyl ester carboxylesterase